MRRVYYEGSGYNQVCCRNELGGSSLMLYFHIKVRGWGNINGLGYDRDPILEWIQYPTDVIYLKVKRRL